MSFHTVAKKRSDQQQQKKRRATREINVNQSCSIERERERERWKQSKNEGIWEEYRISLVLDAQHKDAGLALDQLESIERF